MKTMASIALAMVSVATVLPLSAAEPAGKTESAISQANNEFAFDLYARLRESEQGNLFFSPQNISTAFAMAYAGARGETAEEMARTLHFTVGQDQLHPAMAETLKRLTGGEKSPYQLSLANRLWGQNGFRFHDEFLTVTRDHYNAELGLVDFEKRPEDARSAINAWVEEATQGKIEDLMPQGAVDPDTRLVLTSAIYFQGTWTMPFEKEATERSPFTLAGGEKVDAPLMFQENRFRYGEAEGLQLLQMPYKGDDLSMVLLLPSRADGMGELEKSLSAKQLEDWLAKTRVRKTRVYLPKFKMTSEFSLGDTLQALGMRLAFTESADFSGMSDQRLFISAALHKAFVDVNEVGTEAAAATGIAIGLTSIQIDEPPTFRADHPFVFLIRDNRSGSILFLGRMVDPAEGA